MRITLKARLALLGVAALMTAGTVLAADPSLVPSSSASPDASTAPTSTVPGVDPSETLEPSEAPDASETPDASESPEAHGSADPSEAAEPSESPEAEDQGETLTAAQVTDFVGRLKLAGIPTTAAAFSSLAAKVGVGGAVRTLAFAKLSGKTPAQILAMRGSGMGWGRIAKELGTSPGIGSIMSGGHGQDDAKDGD